MIESEGHACERLHDLDELKVLIPGNGPWRKIQRWIRKRFLISFYNKRSLMYLRSSSAILSERRRQIEHYYWMIHPFSDFRVIFEILILVIYMSGMYYHPFETVYVLNLGKRLSTGHKFMLVFDVVSMLGIVINFRTGYMDRQTQQVYLSSRDAARQYASSYFIFDFLGALPFYVIPVIVGDIKGKVGKAVDLISCVRILRLLPASRFYFNTSEVFGMGFFTYHITRMIVIGCLFIHWSAAVHFLMAKICQTLNCVDMAPKSWIKPVCNANGTHLVQKPYALYVESIFRSMSNSFNVGYGQTIPYTTEDVLVTALVIIMARVLFYCAIGKTLFLVATLNSSNIRYYGELLALRQYMQRRSIKRRMRNRMVDYYDYTLNRTYYHEEKILSTVNTRLREEIMLHTCQRMVENVGFFNNIPMSLIVRIVMSLRPEVYLPNDVIIRAGEEGDSMFFIKYGTVAIYKTSGREICHLEDGAHFGEVALVMPEKKRVANVIAVENCTLYRLEKDDFECAIFPYPDLLARIVHVANERVERSNQMGARRAFVKLHNTRHKIAFYRKMTR